MGDSFRIKGINGVCGASIHCSYQQPEEYSNILQKRWSTQIWLHSKPPRIYEKVIKLINKNLATYRKRDSSTTQQPAKEALLLRFRRRKVEVFTDDTFELFI